MTIPVLLWNTNQVDISFNKGPEIQFSEPKKVDSQKHAYQLIQTQQQKNYKSQETAKGIEPNNKNVKGEETKNQKNYKTYKSPKATKTTKAISAYC